MDRNTLLKTAIVACCIFISPSVFGAAKPQRSKATIHPPATQVANTIWVVKPDEATSCNVNSGISIDRMGQELANAGVRYKERKKIHDNKLRIEMCGTDKGTMNGFLISTSDLEKAKTLGFKEMNAIE